jgi:ABC-type sugar transport system ATPase subunit
VHGVSCAVADGELMVVVGPSGCDKSTPLRMVAGLEGLSAGTVAAVRPETSTCSIARLAAAF